MKKVSILSLHLGCGGAEQSICSLANQLVSFYEVEILAVYQLQDTPFFPLDSRVKVRYLVDFLPNNTVFRKLVSKKKFLAAFKEGVKGLVLLAKKRKAVCKAVKKCDAEIIISTRSYFNEIAGRYRKAETALYAWEHNHPHGNYAKIRKVRRSCRNADTLVCVGQGMAELYRKEFGNSKCKVVYIPNFCENHPAEKDCSLLKGKQLLACGRLEEEKAYSDLIKVFKLLHEKEPDATLTIVGDGSQKELLYQLADDGGVNSSICFLGTLSRDKLNQQYQNADLLVMTSHTESFGLVLVEAMSYGVPCIAFDSAEGACELITEESNGFLIQGRSVPQMAVRIEKYFKLNQEEKAKLGANAVKTAKQYTPENVMKEWRNLLGEGEQT